MNLADDFTRTINYFGVVTVLLEAVQDEKLGDNRRSKPVSCWHVSWD